MNKTKILCGIYSFAPIFSLFCSLRGVVYVLFCGSFGLERCLEGFSSDKILTLNVQINGECLRQFENLL